MRDGSTRSIDLDPGLNTGFESFIRRWEASLVLVSGPGAGSEFTLVQPSQILGRGETAGLRFADPALSSEHATLEWMGKGFRLRDLGSMNGSLVNGSEVRAADLKNGDELRLGSLVFRFVLAARARGPRTYQLPLD